MPRLKKGGKKYFKRARKRQAYGKYGNKPTFRQIRPYGIKPDPFPRVLHTRCKWTYNYSQLSNAVTAFTCGNEQAFRINSIWDPDFTSTGSTVIGWTNFNALYDRYIVRGVKIELEFHDPNQDGVICYASLNQSATLQNQSDDVASGQSLVYSSVINNTGSQKKSFKFYVKPWSMLGLSKLEWMATKSTHTSIMNNNPADVIYLRTACSSPNTGGTTGQIRVSIRLIYYVEFYDRKQLVVT